MKKIKIIILLFVFFSGICYSQDCGNFLQWSELNKSNRRNYSKYLEPKSATIGIKDTLRYNIVFYGNRDYVITFAADHLYYPINIRLLIPGTRDVIYDNATDDYCVSFGVGFYNTQNLIIEATLLADQVKDKIKNNDNVCVIMQLQFKKIFSKKE